MMKIKHKQFDEILTALRAKTATGMSVPVWLYGAPGASKTFLANQLAEELNLKFYPISCGPTTTESRLVGYRNLATGDFVKGHCYEPFKEGGLCLIDEADAADPGVLVACNSISANDRFMFPNGELVQRHENFIMMATGNTTGSGSTSGYVRNRLDAATMNRYVKIKLEYDQEVEKFLADDANWVYYVNRVRDFIEKHSKDTCYVTPRDSMNGAALLRQGIGPGTVCDWVLFNAMSRALREQVIAEVGYYKTPAETHHVPSPTRVADPITEGVKKPAPIQQTPQHLPWTKPAPKLKTLSSCQIDEL